MFSSCTLLSWKATFGEIVIRFCLKILLCLVLSVALILSLFIGHRYYIAPVIPEGLGRGVPTYCLLAACGRLAQKANLIDGQELNKNVISNQFFFLFLNNSFIPVLRSQEG